MSFTSLSRPLIKCPRCHSHVAYADIVANDLDCASVKVGNSARVVLEPCYCQATSMDTDFAAMVRTFERINASHLATHPLNT